MLSHAPLNMASSNLRASPACPHASLPARKPRPACPHASPACTPARPPAPHHGARTRPARPGAHSPPPALAPAPDLSRGPDLDPATESESSEPRRNPPRTSATVRVIVFQARRPQPRPSIQGSCDVKPEVTAPRSPCQHCDCNATAKSSAMPRRDPAGSCPCGWTRGSLRVLERHPPCRILLAGGRAPDPAHLRRASVPRAERFLLSSTSRCARQSKPTPLTQVRTQFGWLLRPVKWFTNRQGM